VKPFSLRALLALAAVLAGCGLSVQSADLFLLKRTGAGRRLTLLVSDDGTVRCNGGAARPLSDKLLIQARDLASTLNDDAKRHMQIQATPHSVARYTVRLQHGTISFPDTAARAHSELAQLELFAVQVAQVPCGLGG
jgi:hypothetical protein